MDFPEGRNMLFPPPFDSSFFLSFVSAREGRAGGRIGMDGAVRACPTTPNYYPPQPSLYVARGSMDDLVYCCCSRLASAMMSSFLPTPFLFSHPSTYYSFLFWGRPYVCYRYSLGCINTRAYVVQTVPRREEDKDSPAILISGEMRRGTASLQVTAAEPTVRSTANCALHHCSR